MKKMKELISEKNIKKRLDELAKQIEKDYEGKEILVLCVLKGASFFTIELTQRIKNKIEFEFIELSSYANATQSSGIVTLKKDIKNSIEGKEVLVIEDIIDTGRTLKFLKEHLETKKPKSVKICTLLNKPSRRVVDVPVQYVGFDIEDYFVLGYGLDYEEYYRNLPYIAYIEEG